VAIRFRGEHALRVDDKCRLSIPAGYRQALQGHGDPRLVIVKALMGPCLLVYPAQAWEAYEDKLSKLPQSDPTVLKVLRFQVSGNHMVEPDGHGRVVLPPSLRAYAAIVPTGEVVVASQIDRFEIWARDKWEAEQVRCAETLPEWSADLARLGL
jgi:MraZ protein